MDTRREPPPDQQAVDVRLTDLGEVAAGLPQLLGFRPRESVVLVGLTGPSGGRVGLTARGDIPPPQHGPELAHALARSVATDGPRDVLLAIVSEAPDDRAAPGADGQLPHRRLVRDLVLALDRIGLPVREAMLVRSGRWWSYDCPHPCCEPGAGTALPAGASLLEVASVAAGQVVAADREELVRRITGPGGAARAAMAVACHAVGLQHAARLLEVGTDAVAEESWQLVLEAAGRCRPGRPAGRPPGLRSGTDRNAARGGDRLGDHEVARIVWGLRDRLVRDRALELALGPDAAAAEVLWTECTRRAPAPLDAAPATLLAVHAWLRGDGATANIALTRALAAEPGYPLAQLLARALAACLGPGELREVILAGAGGSGWG